MTATIVWGTDFRKGREPVTDQTQMAADVVLYSSIPYEPPTGRDEPTPSTGFDMNHGSTQTEG